MEASLSRTLGNTSWSAMIAKREPASAMESKIRDFIENSGNEENRVPPNGLAVNITPPPPPNPNPISINPKDALATPSNYAGYFPSSIQQQQYHHQMQQQQQGPNSIENISA